MMHKAWSSIEEVPYCFSRSSIKFQGHIALEIVEFDSNWAFPDCNSSLNSTMAMKCCTKLETAKKRCPIVFQGHPSNFKVTRDKTSPILTQIGRFGLQAGRSFQIPQICLVVFLIDISVKGLTCWLEVVSDDLSQVDLVFLIAVFASDLLISVDSDSRVPGLKYSSTYESFCA